MGTEILSIFLLAPIALVIADAIKIIRNKNKVKHIILLITGLCGLGYMALSSYIGGGSLIQGIVIGSIFYFPIHFLVYCLLKYFLDKKVTLQ